MVLDYSEFEFDAKNVGVQGLTSRATSMGVVSVDDNGQETMTVLASPTPAQAQLPVDLNIVETAEEPGSQSTQPIDQSQTEIEIVESIDTFDSASTIVSPEAPEVKDMHETRPAPLPASSNQRPQHIPIPVYADATVPDPTERPFTPLILGVPGTPTFALSPVGSPGQGPVPVSISMPQSVIKKMRLQAHERASSNGLFTPVHASLPGTPGEVPAPGTTDAFEGADQHFGAEKSSMELKDEDPFSISASVSPEYSQPVQPGEDEFKNASADLKTFVEEFTHSSPKQPGDRLPSTTPPRDDIAPIVERKPELPESAPLSPQQPTSLQQANSSHSMGVVMRKPSHPILFSDPFPYSLSTPSANALDSLNDGSEEDTEMDNSLSSSSTVDKDVDAQGTDINLNLDELELQYPFNPDVSTPGLPFSIPPDINLQRVINEDLDRPQGHKMDTLKSPFSAETLKEEDPFKLMGTESTVAPGPVKEQTSDVEGCVVYIISPSGLSNICLGLKHLHERKTRLFRRIRLSLTYLL